MGAFISADDVYEYLNGFLNFERKLDPTEYRLDRMVALKELFGAPDEAYRVIHVAGSKGKGSTSTMLASIFREAGEKVGLYTSPHLLSFTERIAIDGEPVDTPLLTRCAEILRDGLRNRAPEAFPGGEAPTYFELLTMLAFLCFREAGCTLAVIEVGLGGRIDSTNVVKPSACVITPIELEHTEILGDTIAKIAAEKAGIIKPGVPSYTSAWKPEALEVIRAHARKADASLFVLGDGASIEDLSVGRGGTAFSLSLSLRGAPSPRSPLRLRTPLIGEVQAMNASLAAAVALDMGIVEDTVIKGLSRARLRARFEIMEGEPVVVLDGAHTPDSSAACSRDFLSLFGPGCVLLFGCAKDKDPAAMARALKGVADRAIITKPGTFKESRPERIAAAFADEGYSTLLEPDTRGALALALGAARATGKPLLVTGSFYLCAEAAEVLALMGR